MKPDETYETPIEANDEPAENADAETELTSAEDQAEVQAAKEAWEDVEDSADAIEDDEALVELAQPFVGRWNELISTTNWEKGRIISEWREALIESDADPSQYSDEAWARRVGGVTAPHVGRLRRVYDRFANTFESYEGVYWSHFLAALDWDDAPLWLEGASREKWSVSGMREQRWLSLGAVESQRPTNSQIIEVDTDEDVVLPAQGGGNTKEYGDEPGVASGPRHDDPDFGDEEELSSLAGANGSNPPAFAVEEDGEPKATPIQPFAGLPELPDDMADAIESLKLSILRHKTAGWEDVDPETVRKYLEAVAVLANS